MKKSNSIPMLPAFKRFINESKSGRRLKPNGTKFKSTTVSCYSSVLNSLEEFANETEDELVIYLRKGQSKKSLMAEKKYWQLFYWNYTRFLYRKGCFDGYVGMQVKVIRVFLGYLKTAKSITIGDHYKQFYVCKPENPVLVLSIEQLQFLMWNEPFLATIPDFLMTARDIFVFGCAVGLRMADLKSLKRQNLVFEAGKHYLLKKSQKTDTDTRIKLPDFCFDIIKKYKNKQPTLLPTQSLANFNGNLKKLGEYAGWTWIVGKERQIQGKSKLIRTKRGKEYRFCDLMSSHMMRRTAITTMILLGMPESLVRKISGHAAGSKEFYRYVKYTQNYLDEHTDAVFHKLAEVRN